MCFSWVIAISLYFKKYLLPYICIICVYYNKINRYCKIKKIYSTHSKIHDSTYRENYQIFSENASQKHVGLGILHILASGLQVLS